MFLLGDIHTPSCLNFASHLLFHQLHERAWSADHPNPARAVSYRFAAILICIITPVQDYDAQYADLLDLLFTLTHHAGDDLFLMPLFVRILERMPISALSDPYQAFPGKFFVDFLSRRCMWREDIDSDMIRVLQTLTEHCPIADVGKVVEQAISVVHPDWVATFSRLFHPALLRLARARSPAVPFHGLVQLEPDKLDVIVGFVYHEGRLTEMLVSYFHCVRAGIRSVDGAQSNVTLRSDRQVWRHVFSKFAPALADLLDHVVRNLTPGSAADFHRSLLAINPGSVARNPTHSVMLHA
jgi:hypothetical protein